MVAEVMGRDAGFIALQSGIGAFADAIIIPEKPCDKTALRNFLARRYLENKTGGLIVMAEGVPQDIKDFIQNDMPLPVRYTVLGHLQRGGPVCEKDRLMASYMGAHAVKLALSDTWHKMIIWKNHQASHIDIPEKLVKRYVSQEMIDQCNDLSVFI